MTRLRSAAALATALALLAPSVATADSREVTKEGTKSVSASLSGLVNPVLNTFWMRFTNGDHELRRIAIAAAGGSALATLEDQNGDDPIRMDARFRSSTVVLKRSVTATCTGGCTIPIERPAGNTFALVALTGFELKRSDGDSNVKKIAIGLTEDKHAYRVEYFDNGRFEYTVKIHYAWISNAYSWDRVGGSRGINSRVESVKMDESLTTMNSVLQGFSFEFLDGDHHLRDIAIEQDVNRQYSVRFNDNNFDDRMTATVDIVYLRQGT